MTTPCTRPPRTRVSPLPHDDADAAIFAIMALDCESGTGVMAPAEVATATAKTKPHSDLIISSSQIY